MGYTKGRRLTYDILKDIALRYRSRVEMQKMDASAYCAARKMKILDDICSHMIPLAFSTPQRILQYILNTILNDNCLYNTRSIIKPYELDIYFEKYKLAVEYNGKGWHSSQDSKNIEGIKKDRCKDLNITLIIIEETSRQYEDDIKNQLIQNIHFIEKATNRTISPIDIRSVIIDYDVIYNQYSLYDIPSIISKYPNIDAFKKENQPIYNYLIKTNRLYMLDDIRQVKLYGKTSNENLLIYVKENYNNYKQIVSDSSIYNALYRRKLIKDVKKFFNPKYGRWCSMSDEDFVSYCKSFTSYSELFNSPAYKILIGSRFKDNNKILYDIQIYFNVFTQKNIKHISDEYLCSIDLNIISRQVYKNVVVKELQFRKLYHS